MENLTLNFKWHSLDHRPPPAAIPDSLIKLVRIIKEWEPGHPLRDLHQTFGVIGRNDIAGKILREPTPSTGSASSSDCTTSSSDCTTSSSDCATSSSDYSSGVSGPQSHLLKDIPLPMFGPERWGRFIALDEMPQIVNNFQWHDDRFKPKNVDLTLQDLVIIIRNEEKYFNLTRTLDDVSSTFSSGVIDQINRDMNAKLEDMPPALFGSLRGQLGYNISKEMMGRIVTKFPWVLPDKKPPRADIPKTLKDLVEIIKKREPGHKLYELLATLEQSREKQ